MQIINFAPIDFTKLTPEQADEQFYDSCKLAGLGRRYRDAIADNQLNCTVQEAQNMAEQIEARVELIQSGHRTFVKAAKLALIPACPFRVGDKVCRKNGGKEGVVKSAYFTGECWRVRVFWPNANTPRLNGNTSNHSAFKSTSLIKISA